jgi:hypothetical protein
MFPGNTRSVDWELNQVIAAGRTSKLLLVFTLPKPQDVPDRAPLDALAFGPLFRLNQIKSVFANTAWSLALDRIDEAASLRTITFNDSGV